MLPDTSNRKAEELQDPNEDVELDEKKAGKTTHPLSEIFEASSENVSINDSALNDGSVIVEVHSLEDASTSVHKQSENEDAKAIVETQDSQPIRNENFCQVTDGVHREKSGQSVNEELLSLLPPWKRQILVNRLIKEKAREKAEREKV